MRTSLLSFALVLAACDPPVVQHAPDVDANVDAFRIDSGPLIVNDSGLNDAFVSIDSYIDVGPVPDVGTPDGGVVPSVLHLDGVFDEPIWTANPSNAMQVNNTPTIAPFDSETLTSLYVARDTDWLYFGFEAVFTPGDAVVFYVDTHFGDTTGVYLMGTGLNDNANTVNQVLSLPFTGTVDFEPEWGWGTDTMNVIPTTYTAHIGWRALSATGSFTPLTNYTASMCNGTACEVQTQLIAGLGLVTGTEPINLVVRLGRPGASGGFSNQTFPTSDSGQPETIGPTQISVLPPT